MRPNLAAEERNGQRDKCKHRPFRKDNKNNTFTVINKHETESKRESTDADSRCFLFYNVTRHQFPALAKPRSPKPFAPKIL